MAVLPTGIGPVTGGYQIERSLRFNSADSTYLSRTFGTPSNNKKFTYSCWIKRTGFLATLFDIPLLSSATNAGRMGISGTGAFGASLDGKFIINTGSDIYVDVQFRDPSAWYHFVCVIDTDNATANDRQILYVNGVRQPNFSGTYTSGAAPLLNTARAHFIGGYAGGGSTPAAGYYGNFYITEVNFIDGQALTPSSFGQNNSNTGVWEPKAYSGTYGTNGFYLNFSDNSGTTSTTLGKDYSGNGNNWTPNNFSVTAGVGNDSLVDTPTPYGTDTGAGGEVRGNYATLNPLATNGGTFSNGNLEYVGPTAWRVSPSTFLLPSTGKWYVEGTLKAAPAGTGFGNVYATIGVVAPSAVSAWSYNSGTSFYVGDAGHYANYSATSSGSFVGNTTGTVLSLAIDRDSNQVTIYQNGVSKATVTLGITSGADLYVFYGSYDGNYGQMALNFGQRPFAYTAPSGFKALCTQNLPTPTIGATSTTQANRYFDATLYAGTATAGGAQTQNISVNFQPDFLWIKNRTSASSYHLLVDAVRGANSLSSNVTDAEIVNGNQALTSTGYTVAGNAGTVQYNPNLTGNNYVGWVWKANGAGSSNTAGTITSTVSANTTSGFSIVTYTATRTSAGNDTIGHGLGIAPAMVISKSRNTSTVWIAQHSSLGTNEYLELSTTSAARNSSSLGAGALPKPTSTVFYGSWLNGLNVSGQTQVAYCFAPVAGYSAFGSYTGNGSTDGPFVFCGFRPAYVLIKRTDTTSNWTLVDYKRLGYNVDNEQLYPNLSNAEATTDLLDLLSNGFKLRSSDASVNASSGTYIYAAFAETPFKYSLAR